MIGVALGVMLKNVQDKMTFVVGVKLVHLWFGVPGIHSKACSEVYHHADTLRAQVVHSNKYPYERRLIQVIVLFLGIGIGQSIQREMLMLSRNVTR